MRIAIISDIHSNLEALSAVIKDTEKQRIDKMWCLGDIVGYAAHPSECLEIIREKADIVLMGNHDCAVWNPSVAQGYRKTVRKGIDFSRNELSKEQIKYLSKLSYVSKNPNELDVDLTHSSFIFPELWRYIMSVRDAGTELSIMKSKIGLFGHTHFTVLYTDKSGEDDVRRLINFGSIGQPRDGDSRAAYGILDFSDKNNIIIFPKRVSYNIDKTARAIKEANLPDIFAQRLYLGR